MYLSVNAKSKAEVKRMLAAGRTFGVESNSPFTEHKQTENGTFVVEGPWYPEPHRWYGTVTVENGHVTKIK